MSEENRVIVSIFAYFLNDAQTKLQEELKEKDRKIRDLDKRVEVLQNRVNDLEEKIDQGEVGERLNNIIISGPELPIFQNTENTTGVAISIIKNVLRTNIQSEEIVKAHRVGKPKHPNQDRRSIVVKFQSCDKKKEILTNVKSIKPPGLYFNEDLTPQRNSIMYVLRKAKVLFPEKISGCKAIDGNVFIWTKDQVGPRLAGTRDTRIKVNSYSKLSSVCTEIIGKSVGEFLPDFEI